jgi:alpha-amylase/alpha-mannosidase (GH57 family)
MTFTSDRTDLQVTIAPESTSEIDPLKTAQGVYVTIHGHFYQPPRENPYLDAIERQPSATPFHDWNERIHHECYRPNAFARIYNDRGEIVKIVNNYEYLSFNIGPTLMSWLEANDPEVYQKILDADRLSSERLNGHGNAIAQVYNHIILPLANEQDKYTQIRWGKEDFRSRFGRDPEGMWLAEAAVDYPTLEALVAEGIKFLVLAPSQVERCRPIPKEDDPHPKWHEVGGGQIDPTRPYRCYLPNGSQKTDNGQRTNDQPYIDIFFYDGPISRDMGFKDVLDSTHNLLGRLGLAVRGDQRPSQLISVATDGETFGHHKRDKERCLAYAFVEGLLQNGWTVTNFAHYLSLHSPTWECELKPVTAWSCAHGVDRWQDDCGCGGGGEWHQQWRRPLRDSLNWLRDRLIEIYDTESCRWLHDPWLARDEYIQVILDRSSENLNDFLQRHQTHALTEAETVDVLRLLEMQRHSLLMFTSCGWFFEEISRPEGVQVLRYAARAIELAGEVSGVDLEPEFLGRIALAPSNINDFEEGATLYEKLVKTSQIRIEQVVAHYAISSLFSPYPTQSQVYCYNTQQFDYQLQRMGTLTLAVGQLQLTSTITQETVHLVFGVLHLGGLDFHCCIQPFSNRLAYTQLKTALFAALNDASAARIVLEMNQHFDGKFFNLQDLFAEERHQILKLLNQETLGRLDRLYAQVYRDNYGVLAMLHQEELPVPQELQVAAEIALSQRCLEAVQGLEQDAMEMVDPILLESRQETSVESLRERTWGETYLLELEAIAAEARHLRCQLNVPDAKKILERLIWRSLWQLLHEDDANTSAAQTQYIDRLVAVGQQLKLNLSLDRVQELYFAWLHGQVGRWCLVASSNDAETSPKSRPSSSGELSWSPPGIFHLLNLAHCLNIDVSPWLD